MIRLSIVIATYNRGENLIRTLNSVVRQSLDPSVWEVVAVNNNSTDNTQELFDGFRQAHPGFNLRMVFEGNQGLSHARNRGLPECVGEYIAIIDDDEEVNAGFGKEYMDFFDGRPDVIAAGGKMIPLYEFEPPKWLSPVVERMLASTIDMGDRIKPFRGERYPIGGNMGFRRRAFEQYGNFNPELGRTGKKLLGGEEKDFFGRLRAGGESIYYIPGPQILHIIPESRFTREHVVRLSRMIGISERIRTKKRSGGAYAKRLFSELVKWAATVVLGLWYIITLRPSKAGYLFIFRHNVTLGLLGREPK